MEWYGVSDCPIRGVLSPSVCLSGVAQRARDTLGDSSITLVLTVRPTSKPDDSGVEYNNNIDDIANETRDFDMSATISPQLLHGKSFVK